MPEDHGLDPVPQKKSKNSRILHKNKNNNTNNNNNNSNNYNNYYINSNNSNKKNPIIIIIITQKISLLDTHHILRKV